VDAQELTALGQDLRTRIAQAMEAGRWDEAEVLGGDVEAEYRLHGMSGILHAYLDHMEGVLDAENARRSEAVCAAIGARDAAAVDELLAAKREFHRVWHDAYIDFMAIVQSHLVTTLGDDALDAALDFVGTRQRSLFDAMNADLTTRVQGFAGAMRAHLGQLEVHEDDEKFTFVSDPCGTGGRLLRSGAYEGDDPLALIARPQPMTMGRRDFPSYCAHCPSWMARLHDDWYGSPNVLEPPHAPGVVCTTHIYKDGADVPTEYRVALRRSPADAPGVSG
jgi:hypothetical protein